jgi:hypothetical protein
MHHVFPFSTQYGWNENPVSLRIVVEPPSRPEVDR